MSVFCVKKISPPVRLGQQLKEAREKSGLDLFTLEQKTRIAEKYLQAIENNDFDLLPPARAYRLAYIREYATAVGYNAEKAVYQFNKENGLGDIKTVHPQHGIKRLQLYLTSWLVRSIVIIAIIATFIGYLAWQVRGVLTPPMLNVYSPAEGAIINQNEIVVEGETEKETHLTINGQDIQVSEQGKFNTVLDLSNGVNVITISATKKHGKNTTLTRHVVVK